MSSQYVTLPETGGGSSGVSSLNSLTGALTIAAGSGISVTPSGSTITIAATGGGSGTVTSVSVVSANGFAGSVANATTTPAITLSTSITGLLKGNGTAISAATAGTDYSAGTSALATGILKSTTSTGALTIAVAADFPTLNQNTTGTAAGLSTVLAISSGGTGAATTSQNFAFIGPTSGSGAPSFRALVAGDIPSLSGSYLPLSGGTLTGALLTINGSAGSPGVQAGTTAGNGLYSRIANVVNLSANSAKAIEAFNDGTNSGLAVGLTSTSAAGFSLYVNNGGSGHYYLTDSGVAYMNYGVATSFIKWGYNAGSVNDYFFELTHGSTNTNPANQVSGGVTYIDPVYTAANSNSTASNFQGFQTCGHSLALNGGLYVYNDNQSGGSETSHMELWTANSGTFAKKLSISATGQVAAQVAGSGFSVKTGSNCKMGTATLSSGTVTVSNTAITSSSIVFLTIQSASGTLGSVYLGTVTAGTSFVISSTSALDASVVGYLIMEPS
jgi:hypothetical protein